MSARQKYRTSNTQHPTSNELPGASLPERLRGIQFFKDATEGFQAWDFGAGFLGLAQRFEKHTFQFERPALLEVDQRGGFVGAHDASAFDLFVGELMRRFVSERGRGPDDFVHQFADKSFPARVTQQFVGRKNRCERLPIYNRRFRIDQGFVAGDCGDAETVKWDVPDEFVPVSVREVFRDFAIHAGVAKHARDIVRARLGPALEFAEDDDAMAEMLHDSGRGAVQTDKTKPAHDLLDGKQPGKFLFIAEPILQGENGGFGADERREQSGELIVGGGFKRNENKIARTDFIGSFGAFGADVEIALAAVNGDAAAFDGIIVRAEEEMDILTGAGEFRAVKTAQRSRADDGDFHSIMDGWIHQSCRARTV